jgi:hypothetical protein
MSVAYDAWLAGLKAGDPVVVVTEFAYGRGVGFEDRAVKRVDDRLIVLEPKVKGERMHFYRGNGKQTGKGYNRPTLQDPTGAVVLKGRLKLRVSLHARILGNKLSDLTSMDFHGPVLAVEQFLVSVQRCKEALAAATTKREGPP